MNNIKEIKEFAHQNQVPIIQEEGLIFLKQKFKEYGCHSFLEIGTAIAHTAIEIASMDETIKVVTIERDPVMIHEAKKNIREMGLEDQITLIEGDALEVMIKGTFDCIFIDAAKAQYTRFFNKYSPLLNEHGIIITDNMNFHGLVEHPERTQNRNTKRLVRKIKEYHDFLESLEDFHVEFYDIGDGIALARRK